MENEKKAAIQSILVITGKLMLITCVVATLIAVINLFTEPVIAANEQAAKNEAIMQIFPDATEIKPMSETLNGALPENITEVYAVYQAGLPLGYCVDTYGMGFADKISMIVGIDADIRITGSRILTISDTPGIGLKVAEPTYLDTYVGITYPAEFAEGSADAITGATYSSRGILEGVNAALSFCADFDLSAADVPPAQNADTEELPTNTTAENEEVTDGE